MRLNALQVFGGVFLCAMRPYAGFADTAVLHPSADATLLQVNPNNSSGGAEFFNAGTTQNYMRNRALLQFDVAAALPPGAQIIGASLRVEVVRSPRDGFEVALFGLHPMMRSWGEGSAIPTDNGGGLGAPAMPGDATWLERFASSDPWAAPGGAAGIDYAPSVSSSTLVYGTGAYEFEGTQEMVRDVQSWLNNPNANYGWMLITEAEEMNFTARRFASREDFSGGPSLIIEYDIVPEPRAWMLGFVAAASALMLRGRRCCPYGPITQG